MNKIKILEYADIQLIKSNNGAWYREIDKIEELNLEDFHEVKSISISNWANCAAAFVPYCDGIWIGIISDISQTLSYVKLCLEYT